MQSPNQFSLTLHGDRGRLSANATLTYHSTALFEIVSYDRDRYIAGAWSADIGTGYKLTKRITLEAGVSNLGAPLLRAYSGQPSRAKEVELFGYQLSAGLNWRL